MNALVRLFVRRDSWGRDERAVARRARRIFGPPRAYQWLHTRGLRLTRVRAEKVSGEWLEVKNPEPGAILYFHGGGYVSCSAAAHRPIAAALARLTRRPVFSFDYRLAPEHRFPAAHDDALAAYRWLLEQGAPAASVCAAGDSAGGGLVLSTLVRARDLGIRLPACAVCFSAWTDLTGAGASVRSNDGRCAMFRPNNIGEFASAYLGDASPLDPRASPVFADLGGLPPLLLQVGSTELLLDDSRRVHDKIQRARRVSVLEVYDDLFHCWQMMNGVVPEAHEALTAAAAFMREHAFGPAGASGVGHGSPGGAAAP